jgi:hypothetical protein
LCLVEEEVEMNEAVMGQGRRSERADRANVSFYLDRGQAEALERLSREQDLSKSCLVRKALQRFLAEEASDARR